MSRSIRASSSGGWKRVWCSSKKISGMKDEGEGEATGCREVQDVFGEVGDESDGKLRGECDAVYIEVSPGELKEEDEDPERE